MLEIAPQKLPIGQNENGDDRLLVTVTNSCLPESFAVGAEALFVPIDRSEPWHMKIEESVESRWPWIKVSVIGTTPAMNEPFWVNVSAIQGFWSFGHFKSNKSS